MLSRRPPAVPCAEPPLAHCHPPACRQAYLRVRQQEGMAEMGDLVLGLATELMSHDFGPTFTSAFEVRKKSTPGVGWAIRVTQHHQHPHATSASTAFQPPLTRPPTPLQTRHQVSNKCVELLMLRQGCDVCCTSDSDRTAIQRFEAQLAAERQQASG